MKGCWRPWIHAVFIAAIGLSSARSQSVDPPVSVAAPSTSDVWDTLQRSIDRAAASRGKVQLAAGVYLVSRPIVLPSGTTMVGAGMERTTIRNLSRFSGPLVQFGMKTPVREITLQDFCVEQSGNDLKGTNCIHGDMANDVRLTRVRARGSRYEGIVGGGHARRWNVEGCEAEDCGNGGPAYTLSTAGINVTSRDAVLRRCKTRRCGQGFEFGNLNVELQDCEADEPSGAAPSIAFNCGSAVVGVSNVRLLRCISNGYKEALTISNGIGRLSGATIESCTFIDGGVTFAGGKPKNSVPTPDQGPDISGSFIRDCVVRWTKPSDKTPSALLYNTGPNADGKVLGREPLTVERLRVQFTAKPNGRVSDPVMGVAGYVSAPVVFRDCVVEGLDEPPLRGDGAVFSVVDNFLPENVSHIRFLSCTAATSAGARRKFDLRLPPKKGTAAAKTTPSTKTRKKE